MKILIVDDHVLIREALKGALKRLKRDAIVLETADSREAFETIQNNSDINLVFLDLSLPDDKAKFRVSFAADVSEEKAAFSADFQVPWGVAALAGAVTLFRTSAGAPPHKLPRRQPCHSCVALDVGLYVLRWHQPQSSEQAEKGKVQKH